MLIKIAFFIVLAIALFCITQQIRMNGKKKLVASSYGTSHYSYALWSKYHNWQYVYNLVGIPFSIATGVLLANVLPEWLAHV